MQHKRSSRTVVTVRLLGCGCRCRRLQVSSSKHHFAYNLWLSVAAAAHGDKTKHSSARIQLRRWLTVRHDTQLCPKPKPWGSSPTSAPPEQRCS